MVKIGRGQQNYRHCRCRHCLQSFATMKKNSVIRSAMDALINSKKNQPPSCSHSLFIHIFQFDFRCTSYVLRKSMKLIQMSLNIQVRNVSTFSFVCKYKSTGDNIFTQIGNELIIRMGSENFKGVVKSERGGSRVVPVERS